MNKNWTRGFWQGNIVYKLNVLANALNETADAIFIELVGIDIRTIRVLRLVDDNPDITFAEIAKLTSFERSMTSRLIQSLVRSDLVQRRNRASDARQFGLFITDKGKKLRAKADLISDRGTELVFGQLGVDENARFAAAMEKLAIWIDSDAYRNGLDEIQQELRTLK